MALANPLYPDRAEANRGPSFPAARHHFFSSMDERKLDEEDRSAGRNVASELALAMGTALIIGAIAVVWIAFVAH